MEDAFSIAVWLGVKGVVYLCGGESDLGPDHVSTRIGQLFSTLTDRGLGQVSVTVASRTADSVDLLRGSCGGVSVRVSAARVECVGLCVRVLRLRIAIFPRTHNPPRSGCGYTLSAHRVAALRPGVGVCGHVEPLYLWLCAGVGALVVWLTHVAVGVLAWGLARCPMTVDGLMVVLATSNVALPVDGDHVDSAKHYRKCVDTAEGCGDVLSKPGCVQLGCSTVTCVCLGRLVRLYLPLFSSSTNRGSRYIAESIPLITLTNAELRQVGALWVPSPACSPPLPALPVLTVTSITVDAHHDSPPQLAAEAPSCLNTNISVVIRGGVTVDLREGAMVTAVTDILREWQSRVAQARRQREPKQQQEQRSRPIQITARGLSAHNGLDAIMQVLRSSDTAVGASESQARQDRRERARMHAHVSAIYWRVLAAATQTTSAQEEDCTGAGAGAGAGWLGNALGDAVPQSWWRVGVSFTPRKNEMPAMVAVLDGGLRVRAWVGETDKEKAGWVEEEGCCGRAGVVDEHEHATGGDVFMTLGAIGAPAHSLTLQMSQIRVSILSTAAVPTYQHPIGTTNGANETDNTDDDRCGETLAEVFLQRVCAHIDADNDAGPGPPVMRWRVHRIRFVTGRQLHNLCLPAWDQTSDDGCDQGSAAPTSLVRPTVVVLVANHLCLSLSTNHCDKDCVLTPPQTGARLALIVSLRTGWRASCGHLGLGVARLALYVSDAVSLAAGAAMHPFHLPWWRSEREGRGACEGLSHPSDSDLPLFYVDGGEEEMAARFTDVDESNATHIMSDSGVVNCHGRNDTQLDIDVGSVHVPTTAPRNMADRWTRAVACLRTCLAPVAEVCCTKQGERCNMRLQIEEIALTIGTSDGPSRTPCGVGIAVVSHITCIIPVGSEGERAAGPSFSAMAAQLSIFVVTHANISTRLVPDPLDVLGRAVSGAEGDVAANTGQTPAVPGGVDSALVRSGAHQLCSVQPVRVSVDTTKTLSGVVVEVGLVDVDLACSSAQWAILVNVVGAAACNKAKEDCSSCFTHLPQRSSAVSIRGQDVQDLYTGADDGRSSAAGAADFELLDMHPPPPSKRECSVPTERGGEGMQKKRNDSDTNSQISRHWSDGGLLGAYNEVCEQQQQQEEEEEEEESLRAVLKVSEHVHFATRKKWGSDKDVAHICTAVARFTGTASVEIGVRRRALARSAQCDTDTDGAKEGNVSLWGVAFQAKTFECSYREPDTGLDVVFLTCGTATAPPSSSAPQAADPHAGSGAVPVGTGDCLNLRVALLDVPDTPACPPHIYHTPLWVGHHHHSKLSLAISLPPVYLHLDPVMVGLLVGEPVPPATPHTGSGGNYDTDPSVHIPTDAATWSHWRFHSLHIAQVFLHIHRASPGTTRTSLTSAARLAMGMPLRPPATSPLALLSVFPTTPVRATLLRVHLLGVTVDAAPSLVYRAWLKDLGSRQLPRILLRLPPILSVSSFVGEVSAKLRSVRRVAARAAGSVTPLAHRGTGLKAAAPGGKGETGLLDSEIQSSTSTDCNPAAQPVSNSLFAVMGGLMHRMAHAVSHAVAVLSVASYREPTGVVSGGRR